MEVQVKEYKMKKKVIIIFSTIVGLKMVYIYIYMLCLMHFLWKWHLMFLVLEWIIHSVNVKWVLCARLQICEYFEYLVMCTKHFIFLHLALKITFEK